MLTPGGQACQFVSLLRWPAQMKGIERLALPPELG
jgi:hypothetical protein